MRSTLATATVLLLLVAPAAARADGPPPGLVAAYAFDEGSGTVAGDASGNGHTGLLSNAAWTTGRYGGALSFNGTDAHVLLGSLGTFYNDGFTLEAWVRKDTATKNDVAVVGTYAGGGGPMLWVDHLATRYHLTLGSSLGSYLDSGANPRADQWQHVAATFNGTTARFYLDGEEVASREFSGTVGGSDVWRIGAYGSSPGGFFDGVIDDVRIYDRALPAAQIVDDMSLPVGVVENTAPTTPGDFQVTSATQSSVAVSWSASTDDVGVLGYALSLDGAQVATTGSTSFTFTGLACGVPRQLGVEAFDGAGNASPRALLTASADCGAGGGLVASYSFDDGTGGVLSDSSGNGHTGTIAGAAWVPGRHGGGLSFDGVDDHVDLGQVGTFYGAGFTLEAWVRKETAKNDVAVVGTWTSNGGPMVWVDHLASRYRVTFGTTFSGYLDAGVGPSAGQWQHVAATYEGATARFYVDGVEVSARAASGPGSSNTWRIGAYGSTPGGYFDGVVDDVRIYDRALSPTEVMADMGTPVTIPESTADVTPPSAPGSLAATILPSRVTLTWGAATDDVGVTTFNVHRSTEPGFTPTAANRIARPTAAIYTDADLPEGSYYYKVTAEDAAGNVGPSSNEASADVPAPDTTPPTVTVTSPAAGVVSGPLVVAADASDQWGIAGVRFEVDGSALGPEDTTAPYTATWDTRAELNGAHTLRAVARDTAGNTTASPVVQLEVENEGGAAAGLRASYAFDESGGSSAADSSGNDRTGTLVDATRAGGRYGRAASLDGEGGRVDLPALGTFYGSGFSLEAWVNKESAKRDVAVVGTWISGGGGGPMIWIDHANGRYRLTLGNTFEGYLDSSRAPVIGQWQHVAATYDGAVAKFYVDGVQTASRAVTGSVGVSNAWRIGAYSTPAIGLFDGLIDNVRIYDRALTADEVASNRLSRIQLDDDPPAVESRTPAPGATEVGITDAVTVRFDEPMQAASITTATFSLRVDGGAVVPANVSYDAATNVAELAPIGALEFGTTYTAELDGAITDLADNPLDAPGTWSFTTQANPPPVLVVASTSNPFGLYLGEILRNEGVSSFATIDITFITPALLSRFDVVLLGEMTLTPAQVSTLSGWVSAGGNLIAMRPDAQLAGLLGLVDSGGTLSDAYLAVDNTSGAGQGIVGTTIQYHGAADRYTLSGANPIATLYADRTTPTASPAVTMRAVGSRGGQAAAFAYDLARSVAYTRQGNPAWAGRERDGVLGLRPNDMFYGAAADDPQPDWIDTSKIAIPQADEQQRLLVNMVTRMVRDQLPLPRFWYLPRGAKAAVVLSGDDHSPTASEGSTAANFDHFKALSPPGCSVADWQCVRATSYVYPESSLTPAQADSYAAEGFEIALHPNFGGACPPAPTAAQLEALLDSQLAQFRTRYPNLPSPATSRTHCVEWPDWASEAKIEAARGIRLDANYYHYPGSWIGDKPGFMNGGGFPMRFADLDGTPIDAYQQHTHMHDEAGQQYPATIDALLDNAIGPNGFYGAFGTNIHHDFGAPQPMNEEIVAAAQARGVPLVSYAQLLDWVDGRAASSIGGIDWNSGTLRFTTTVAPGALGLRTMLPTRGPGGRTLSSLTCGGSATPYTLQTVKGLRYAMFQAADGSCTASYD
jgi:hypothetical protein